MTSKKVVKAWAVVTNGGRLLWADPNRTWLAERLNEAVGEKLVPCEISYEVPDGE